MVDNEENGRTLKKQVSENHLDFIYKLFKEGVFIGDDNINLLKKKGYIEADQKVVQQPEFIDTQEKINEHNLRIKTEDSAKADANIDITIADQESSIQLEIITSEELQRRRHEYNHIFEGRSTDITRDEWLSKCYISQDKKITFEPDFIDWINSINVKGFANKIHYRKFSLYCQQAYTWLAENKSYIDFDDEDDQMDFFINELKRCDENALYFLNKYVYYKEGDAEDKSGRVKYVARPVHEFMAYMDDCGYSQITAKGRQIAATTTKMALDVRNAVFKANHFMKFITEDVEKAQEIFEDKLKYCFAELPEWMRPNVLNDRDQVLKFGYKQEKGKKEGVGSKIMVTAPKRTAVAGGAPQVVKIDEGGNINILGIMLGNARPTMLWLNPKTKRMELRRRIDVWGTGGEMEKGGKAFETEFMAIYKDWMEGKYHHAIVPIFFDWTCRFGITQEDYDRERAVAYAKGADDKDPDAKKHITEFHQSYPSSLSDVFRTSAKTLVDEAFIESNIDRIRRAKVTTNHKLVQYGYFEPIYDITKPTHDGSDVPFHIIGANFIPTSDIDRRASTCIFLHPEKGWKNRYFQGTDPIDTYTGSSNFSSTIWDKYYSTPAAILNWRVPDYPQVFLQSMLLNMYYDMSEKKEGILELVESNRGTSYTDYRKNKNFDKKMVLNYQLPSIMQNNTTINDGVGIDNKGQRNTMIINRMFEMFKFYGENMHHDVLFEQLKTFTCHVSDHGKEVWGPVNRKFFMDDTLFFIHFFLYLC